MREECINTSGTTIDRPRPALLKGPAPDFGGHTRAATHSAASTIHSTTRSAAQSVARREELFAAIRLSRRIGRHELTADDRGGERHDASAVAVSSWRPIRRESRMAANSSSRRATD